MVFVHQSDILNYQRLEIFKGNSDIPKFSTTNPSIHELLGICIFGKRNSQVVCKKRPYHVRENATLILNQGISKIAHPFDLDADDSLGSSIKKEFVRFYEVIFTNDNSAIMISKKIKTEKSNQGGIIGGSVNVLEGRNSWYYRKASPGNIYAVIRRGVEDKAWKTYDKKYIRWITYVMTLQEFNTFHKTLKNKKEYNLKHNTIIAHYNVNEGEPTDFDINLAHGNCKEKDTVYRPTMHSVNPLSTNVSIL